MRARLIKIGDSQGIIIPQSVIDDLGLTDWVDVERIEDHIEIRPVMEIRKGWADAALICARDGDDDFSDLDALSGDGL
jgi:antitoxin MazE